MALLPRRRLRSRSGRRRGPNDLKDMGIVLAIDDFGTGWSSLVEGVETGEQVDLLQRLGVGRAQGYLYGPPLPPGRFARHPAVVPS